MRFAVSFKTRLFGVIHVYAIVAISLVFLYFLVAHTHLYRQSVSYRKASNWLPSIIRVSIRMDMWIIFSNYFCYITLNRLQNGLMK